MIGNILDNTTELYMIKYTFGEIFSSGRATLCKNPSDESVPSGGLTTNAAPDKYLYCWHMKDPVCVQPSWHGASGIGL